MILVRVQNCFSPTGDRPSPFRRIETNVVRLSFSIANENENEPLGCAITHWRRWLRLRHTYRISSSAAERSNKTRPAEFRRSFLIFSLSPSPFFLRFAQRSTILQPVKGPSNCSIENEHLSRRLMATIRSSHAGSLFSLTVSSIFNPKPRP